MNRVKILMAAAIIFVTMMGGEAKAITRGDQIGQIYANSVNAFARQNFGKMNDFTNVCNLLRDTVDLPYVHRTLSGSLNYLGGIRNQNLSLGYMAGWILWRRNFFAEQRTTNYQYSFIPGNNNVGRGDFNSQEYIEFQLRAGGDILKIWVSRTDRRAADGGLTAQIANIGNSRGNFLTTAPGDLGQQGFDGRAFASPTAEGRIQEFLANVVHSSAANGCQ